MPTQFIYLIGAGGALVLGVVLGSNVPTIKLKYYYKVAPLWYAPIDVTFQVLGQELVGVNVKRLLSSPVSVL